MSKAGGRTLHLEDSQRRNWGDAGARPLLTVLWYPARDDADAAPFAFGSPQALFHSPPVAIDARPASEESAYPLVLMSHGTGRSALQMGWPAYCLVARGGFAVVELMGGRCSSGQFERSCSSAERDLVCDGPREFPGVIDEIPRLKRMDRLFRDSLRRHNRRVVLTIQLSTASGFTAVSARAP